MIPNDSSRSSKRVTCENTFYVLSAPQMGCQKQELRTLHKRDDILAQAQPTDILIVPGNLTNNGQGHKRNPFGYFLCMLCCLQKKMTNDNHSNQLLRLKKFFLSPTKEKMKNIYTCIGHNDRRSESCLFFSYNPVLKYVKQSHGSLVYKKEIDGLIIFSLSTHPTIELSKWLGHQLNLTTSQPFVVFFHHNLNNCTQDLWSTQEKDAFYRAISPHKTRLIFIAEGQKHDSYIQHWRGMKIINGGGDQAICVKIKRNVRNELIDVQASKIPNSQSNQTI